MKQFFVLTAAALVLTACAAPAEERAVERQFLAMDTVMSFSLYGPGANETVQTAAAEIQRLEDALSRTDPASKISQLNRSSGQQAEPGGEICRLLDAAAAYSAATGGAFDITIAPVMDAWGFTADTQQVPEPLQLEAALERVGMGRVHLGRDGTSVQLEPGTELDLGGIAKGYASDCLAALFARRELPRGWVSLGGNVLAWGSRPDGDPWRIGIQDPRHPDQQRFIGTLGLEDAFAVTSGGYQRYFEQNGVIYHHILDPSTGQPASSGLISVTVVAAADRQNPEQTPGGGTMCDALSTALFVMGEERALDFWRSSGYDFQLILVTADGRVLTTAGLEGLFTPEDGSGYLYETVS